MDTHIQTGTQCKHCVDLPFTLLSPTLLKLTASRNSGVLSTYSTTRARPSGIRRIKCLGRLYDSDTLNPGKNLSFSMIKETSSSKVSGFRGAYSGSMRIYPFILSTMAYQPGLLWPTKDRQNGWRAGLTLFQARHGNPYPPFMVTSVMSLVTITSSVSGEMWKVPPPALKYAFAKPAFNAITCILLQQLEHKINPPLHAVFYCKASN